MQFYSLGSSKMEIFETDFFDTVTIQRDQIPYVKHVLAPLYVFCVLFGFFWGGGSQGVWNNMGTTGHSRLRHRPSKPLYILASAKPPRLMYIQIVEHPNQEGDILIVQEPLE